MFVKCHRCKTQVKVPTAHTRFCGNCLKHKRKESDIIYKRNRGIYAGLYGKKCRVCFKKFNAFHSVKYCSNKCRTFTGNLPFVLRRREKSILRKTKQLKEIKIKYAHLL